MHTVNSRLAWRLTSLFASVILITACSSDLPNNTPGPLPSQPVSSPFVRQPVPYYPEIRIILSGLAGTDDIANLNIYGDDGGKDLYGTFPGNGSWELGLGSLSGEENYSIVVEAEGYTVEPERYPFRIEDETVYSIQEGQKGDEVKSFSFHFTEIPGVTPTP